FILFEVLDIDGSDFSPPSASVEARPAEAHHDDLKRAILAVALAYAAVTLPVVHRALAQALRAERRTRPPAVSFTPSLLTHALLPRAGLSDGSAACPLPSRSSRVDPHHPKGRVTWSGLHLPFCWRWPRRPLVPLPRDGRRRSRSTRLLTWR